MMNIVYTKVFWQPLWDINTLWGINKNMSEQSYYFKYWDVHRGTLKPQKPFSVSSLIYMRIHEDD